MYDFDKSTDQFIFIPTPKILNLLLDSIAKTDSALHMAPNTCEQSINTFSCYLGLF